MADPVRWGILGTGGIARGFAEDLRTIPGAALVAVGSRDGASARAFAARFGAPRPHDSYEALVGDANVDIVYVATPHHRHRDDALLALDAGKAVLCEKPFALNAKEARDIATKARERGRFCMEAMWTRFLPILGLVRSRVGTDIGDVRSIVADFGYAHERRPESRLFDPALGGGALLDLGVYGVSLAHWFFGPPSSVHAAGTIGGTGVDEQAAVLLGWPDGRMATVTTSIVAQTANTATLVGERGSITLEAPFCAPPAASVRRFTSRSHAHGQGGGVMRRVLRGASRLAAAAGGGEGRITAARQGHGYQYEATEAMRCLRDGATESRVMPLDESVAIMETLDAARARLGLRYPGEG